MIMQPRIETINEKKLVGQRLKMSMANNGMSELWKRFGTKRKLIANSLTNDLISLAIYEPTYFTDFRPANAFERWAAVEVAALDQVPDEMESLVLTGGLYAVFDYKGPNTDNSIFQYIFGEWLPKAEYILDNRPHFEVLGAKYKNNDPDSEEEIWIPIKKK